MDPKTKDELALTAPPMADVVDMPAATVETVTSEAEASVGPLDPNPAVPGTKSADGLLRIGQLAERCGKSARALHLYEEMGLLKPALRSRGGFRLYSPGAVERVEWISRLQDGDVSLGEIQTLLRDLDSRHIGTEAMTRLRQLLDQKLAQCREQREKLNRLEADLLAGLQYLDGCKTCGPEHLTTECGDCRLHGHDGHQPLMVAGVHTS